METLKNAPITEAVFDLRVEFTNSPKIEDLEAMYPDIKHSFPVKKMNSVFQATFGVNKGHSHAGFQEDPNGFSFKTDDGRKIIQMRLDGYTFNKLKPYDNWESFRDEARKYWDIFEDRMSPSQISRLALRYINRFDLPLPIDNIDQFLNTGPKVSKDISHTLNGFVLRLEIAQDDGDASAIVTIVRDKSQASSKNYTLILDIDVFQVVELPSKDEAIWTKFESLRNYKNEVFFNSVTEKTLSFFG